MPGSVPGLDALDVGLAATLVLLAGALSVAMGLGLFRSLLVAAARSAVQLTLIGLVLRWIFARTEIAFTGAAMLFMIAVASRASLKRAGWSLDGAAPGAFGTLAVTAGATAIAASALLIQADPWHRAQVMIPILGMLLGNALTGISLSLDSLLGAFAEEKERVEAELALGASRWEAARAPLRRAVRRGLTPIINAMTVAGLVSLPGMMTGQILAGAEPLDAVRYQLLILFLIAGVTAVGCVLLGAFAMTRLIDDELRIRSDRIRARGEG
ncbi:MAG: iron export ABC transporter permease subunit FetB [Myxococcota bacterium]